MKRQKVLAASLLVLLLAGCSALRTGRPTPDISLQPGMPIRDATQALNAAQAILSSTRLQAKQTPRLRSVEEMSRAEALRRVATPMEQGESPDARVWLVILEGQWQVIPPDPSHTITPASPFSGCVYVVMDANEPGHSQVGGVECGR